MINQADVWQNAIETMRAYFPYYQEDAVQKIRDAQAQDVWFALLLARGKEPQLFTQEYFQQINPYASAARLAEIVNIAVAEGFLKEHERGSYHLTAKGKAVLDAFFDTAHVLLVQAPALPEAEMHVLASLLDSLVAAVEESAEPTDKGAFVSSRWTDPGENAQASLRIDQSITDLARYREDAHRAAWQPTGLSGMDWETLTFIWNDEADNAIGLAEKLERRGLSSADYQAALDRLLARGWLEKEEETYKLTGKGQQVRDHAEEETDQIFYESWSVLDEHELEELDHLLDALRMLLKESVPAEPVAV